MNKHDLWAKSYYNPFDSKRLIKFMREIEKDAADKGLDVLDPKIIDESSKEQNYLFNMLLDVILNAARPSHELLSDLNIRLLLRDRDDFNANIELETADKNKYILFVDNLMTSTIHELTTCMLYWSIVKDDDEEWTSCFRYMVFVISEYGIKRIRPAHSTWAHKFVRKMIAYSENTAHLFSDVYIVIIEFILAHEIGHLILGHHDSSNRTLEDEFAADDFAYKLILDLIVEQAEYIATNNKRPTLDMHNEYIYLAPLMFFDIMELIDYFRCKVFKDTKFTSATQDLSKRKERLESWVFRIQDYYNFHSSVGNDVYRVFLNMKDAFIENVDIKSRLGKTLISDVPSIAHAALVDDKD